MSPETFTGRDHPGPAEPLAEAPFELRLPQFEGALDLLLYLVRSQGLDILDIPIVDVARQYNAYLDRMRELDLEIASEYLVMAATLAYIKSQMMLPRPKSEEGEEEDPRQELVEQLLEYEKYKKAAESLGAMDGRRDLLYSREAPPPEELAEVQTVEASLSDLVCAFERVLARLESEDVNQVIRRENFSIADMMERLVEVLPPGGRASFRELLSVCRSRMERVVMFLALLELMRVGRVAASQRSWRDDIEVGMSASPPPDGSSLREGEAGAP